MAEDFPEWNWSLTELATYIKLLILILRLQRSLFVNIFSEMFFSFFMEGFSGITLSLN